MDMKSGKSMKQQLKESTQLLVGILFKAGSSWLGKTGFDVHRENEKEIQKIQKVRLYQDQIKQASEVFQKKLKLETMMICKLTTICKPLKRKEDDKQEISS